MDVSVITQKNENNTEVIIETKATDIAVIIRDNGGERIYLPHEISQSNQTYYTENKQDLEETERGYKIQHPNLVEEVNVIS